MNSNICGAIPGFGAGPQQAVGHAGFPVSMIPPGVWGRAPTSCRPAVGTDASASEPAVPKARVVKLVLTNLNIAFIDIATGADLKIIRQYLAVAQSHLNAVYGHNGRQLRFLVDYVAAELCLQDGTLGTANGMFERSFLLSQDISTELMLLCLERLGDLSTGMNCISTALPWGGVFLSLALKCKNKRQTVQAFQCLDQIADILNNRGEVIKAVELWKAARPLFKRSSQMIDIVKIDAKLAEVNSVVLVEYEEQLKRLLELHVRGRAPEEAYIVADEEEDKSAQGSDFGDTGRQGVLV
ncbi:hypothetical protein C8J57DRAFT_1258140 [Mycena rebaudengoi]|nr:hypothetical protein C8J57DRAFT_1258140 [Mycena rebaudengoi]